MARLRASGEGGHPPWGPHEVKLQRHGTLELGSSGQKYGR